MQNPEYSQSQKSAADQWGKRNTSSWGQELQVYSTKMGSLQNYITGPQSPATPK